MTADSVYKYSRLLLRFDDFSIEERYRQYLLSSSLSIFQIAYFMGGVSSLFLVPAEYHLFPGKSSILVAVRLIQSFLLLVIFILLKNSAYFQRKAFQCNIFATLFLGLCWCVALWEMRNEQNVYFVILSLSLVLVYLFSFFRLSFLRVIALGGSLLVMVYIFVFSLLSQHGDGVLYSTVFLSVFFFIGVTSFYVIEEFKIKEFVLEEKLQECSFTDPLTGLGNRHLYSTVIEEKLGSCFLSQTRSSSRDTEWRLCGVLLFDLDYFKEVNDTFGHRTGDLLLKAVSDTLIQMIRSSDYAIRWGGEEFLIVLPGADKAYLQKFSEELRSEVEATSVLSDGKFVSRTCSVGALSLPADTITTSKQMSSTLDEGLYKAKNNGRNRVCLIS